MADVKIANVKMTFTVEIDGKVIVNHQIEELRKTVKQRFHFNKERELAVEIINKLNSFNTTRKIDALPWADFEEIKKQDPRTVSFALKDYLD